jgi:hypothetical protein
MSTPSRLNPARRRVRFFRGKLPSNALIFLFDLTLAEMRGVGGDAGWSLVIEEKPGEPRFGLDPRAARPTGALNSLANLGRAT